MSPMTGLPTDPLCVSHSAPLITVSAISSVPPYSSQIFSRPEQLDPPLLQPFGAL
ncbi:hypothetical protein [Actinomadura madurae]|uniref:hypothetical protein n=1 Tax=Actinomadura madurae TaxID=1993 RepID=UPI0024E1CAD5|nr:hypothetical protein [Actinomadura madurae]